MSTISRQIAENIAKHGGWRDGDRSQPRCLKIIVYRNANNGDLAYGAVFESDRADPMRYEKETEAVQLFWSVAELDEKPNADGWFMFPKPLPFGPCYNEDGSVIDSVIFRAKISVGMLYLTVKGPRLVGHSDIQGTGCIIAGLFDPQMQVLGYRKVWSENA